MKTKNILLTLLLVMSSVFVFGQTTAPDATKPWVILDSTYSLESVTSSSNTSADIYYGNTSGNVVKGIQFSFSYDNTVFDSPTVTYNTTSGPVGYMATDVDTSSGVVKVVWVYDGASTTFDIITGNMFSVDLPFKSSYTNGTVAGLDFTTDLTAYYAKSDGTDGALGTQDNGGNFIEPAFDYTATILNNATNPAESIPVILQKSSDGSTWNDVATVTTAVDGTAVFSEYIDQGYWQIRLKIASGLDASTALSTADANMIAQIAAGIQSASGVQFYTANPNQTNGVTASDSYLVFSRLAQGNSSYASNPDVLFFTEAQYNTINASSSDQSGSIPGLTEFLSPQINGTTTGNFYLLILGDANGTGLN
tara:strand:+ start:1084 stop:2178 length:1095 start_codon:yes stop_codon:yes gene_type:complete